MRIIKRTTLDRFALRHPDAKGGLGRLYDVMLDAEWSAPSEVRDTIRTADVVGDFIVFNVNHNDYRLVVRADYRRQIVYIWDFYTHAEYDRIDFRAIDLAIKTKAHEPG